MKYSTVRKMLAPVRFTPLHPQWFAFRQEQARFQRIGSLVSGLVLDVGAGQQRVSLFLPPTCSYISLDYPETARDWYHTRPATYGDGQSLPFANDTFDFLLLLDVLEHIPRPEECISELHRVLKPGGNVVIHVPFLYPLHDEPLDFHRWTVYGLKELAAKFDFHIESSIAAGSSAETAALLANLAYSRIVLGRSTNTVVRLLFALLLPPIVVFSNIRGWLIDQIADDNGAFMPHSYEVVMEKPTS